MQPKRNGDEKEWEKEVKASKNDEKYRIERKCSC